MQMIQLTSNSLSDPPILCFLSLPEFEGRILLVGSLLRAQVTLPTTPFHFGKKLGCDQSVTGTCSAW